MIFSLPINQTDGSAIEETYAEDNCEELAESCPFDQEECYIDCST